MSLNSSLLNTNRSSTARDHEPMWASSRPSEPPLPSYIRDHDILHAARASSSATNAVVLARELIDRETASLRACEAMLYPSSTVPKDIVLDAARSRVAAAVQLLRVAQSLVLPRPSDTPPS